MDLFTILSRYQNIQIQVDIIFVLFSEDSLVKANIEDLRQDDALM